MKIKVCLYVEMIPRKWTVIDKLWNNGTYNPVYNTKLSDQKVITVISTCHNHDNRTVMIGGKEIGMSILDYNQWMDGFNWKDQLLTVTWWTESDATWDCFPDFWIP
jgi:hypothetical protein